MSKGSPLDAELMGLMVHDLKNPLAALLANLGYVGSVVAEDESTKEAVDDCLLSTEVLSRLIDNLAAISTLSAPSDADGGGEATVEAAVHAVEQRMRRHAAAAGLDVHASAEPECGSVGVTGALLQLAVENLVSAGLAYAPGGSAVRIAARRDGDQVCVAVQDDGPTVTAEMGALIGELAGQLELKGASGARYARGLGLHVAALVARRAGGSLVVADPGGETGCVLELRLPAV